MPPSLFDSTVAGKVLQWATEDHSWTEPRPLQVSRYMWLRNWLEITILIFSYAIIARFNNIILWLCVTVVYLLWILIRRSCVWIPGIFFLKFHQLWKCLYFRSLVCSELLFPWIQDLPDQLVQLGNSNPRSSGIIISSISFAALHMNTSVLQTTVESIFSKWSLFLASSTADYNIIALHMFVTASVLNVLNHAIYKSQLVN